MLSVYFSLNKVIAHQKISQFASNSRLYLLFPTIAHYLKDFFVSFLLGFFFPFKWWISHKKEHHFCFVKLKLAQLLYLIHLYQSVLR